MGSDDATAQNDGGPLAGVRIVEVAGIGPAPFAAMVLADLGADVIRLERPGATGLLDAGSSDVINRGRPAIPVDLKSTEGVAALLDLADRADALIEGFRPGVMERLGLGPDVALARNPRLVYGRMTGYGQTGPSAQLPGHDVNYIAAAGTLSLLARAGERPLFPLNLLGDYGGGGMLLALGIVCGVLAARRTGEGQVVDAAMVDGAALLSTVVHGLTATGGWNSAPGTNVLDSGAHFYEVYETSDGCHVAVGAIEPAFYGRLVRLLELDPDDTPQWDRARWPELKARFAAVFATRTRDEWTAVLAAEEACATPVLTLEEAIADRHNIAREVFAERDGVMQPGSAPRFSGTPAPRLRTTRDAASVLSSWGVGRA